LAAYAVLLQETIVSRSAYGVHIHRDSQKKEDGEVMAVLPTVTVGVDLEI